ncbi:MAG: glycerophosphodiester phosphodiesterase [Clostridiaceae bacterium]|nr:glycerophosphodiester phosphodiesterase [Clostridiaceae bacterium]
MLKIWGHRGASGYAPENTLESFSLAVEMGVDGVELDVQMTRDGYLVVIHDELIDRVSDGSGLVKDYTLRELKRFCFNKTHPEFPCAKIPTLREVYEILKNTSIIVNVELKTGNFFYDGLEERVLDLSYRMGIEERIIYSSFNHYSVKKIKTIDPNAKAGILFSNGIWDAVGYAKKLGADALHPVFSNLQYTDLMSSARKEKLMVHVWTVNSEEQLKDCLQLGVDAVITNYPDKMVEYTKKREM